MQYNTAIVITSGRLRPPHAFSPASSSSRLGGLLTITLSRLFPYYNFLYHVQKCLPGHLEFRSRCCSRIPPIGSTDEAFHIFVADLATNKLTKLGLQRNSAWAVKDRVRGVVHLRAAMGTFRGTQQAKMMEYSPNALCPVRTCAKWNVTGAPGGLSIHLLMDGSTRLVHPATLVLDVHLASADTVR